MADAAARAAGAARARRRGVGDETAVAEDDLDLIGRFEAAGMRFSGIAVDPDPVGLRGLVDLVDLVERGELRVPVAETFPFEPVVDAHRELDRGHLSGKLVLTVP